jgi:hypothetical protein
MKVFTSIFSFYINASIHVAFAVLALVGVTSLEFQFDVSPALCGFVFFGTITGYNFVKYAKIAGLKHRDLTNSLKSIQVFSFLCFGIVIYFSFRLSIHTLLAAGGFAFLTFFYAVPILKKKSLRSMNSLKIFIVALVWAGITVVIPLIETETNVNANTWLSFMQRFLIVIVLTLPFEIRDLEYDLATLKTLPQQFGLKKVKVLGLIMLLICLFLEGFKSEISKYYFLSLVITCCLIGGVLIASQRKQFRYFSSFWVESIPIVWLGILMLILNFF